MRSATARAVALLIAALLLLAFATPLRALWAAPGAPWWLVYIVWGAAIVALAALARASPRASGDAAREAERER